MTNKLNIIKNFFEYKSIFVKKIGKRNIIIISIIVIN